MGQNITKASAIRRAITVATGEVKLRAACETKLGTAALRSFAATVPAKAFLPKKLKAEIGAFTDALEAAGEERRTAQRKIMVAGQFITFFKLEAGVTESEVSEIIEANGFDSVAAIYAAVKPSAKPKLDENGDAVEAVEVPKEAKLLKYAITQSGGDVVKALALLGAAMQLGEKAASALKNEAVA